jgi:hypothetical protein
MRAAFLERPIIVRQLCECRKEHLKPQRGRFIPARGKRSAAPG